MSDLTTLLDAAAQGDRHAAGQLLPLVYEELRQLAAQRLAHEPPGQTLQATALVHEVYLRLAGNQSFANRGHFFAAAAEAMRRILIDSARRKHSRKHGGGLVRHALDEVAVVTPEPNVDLLALDAALEQLARKDQRKAELVKLRYFVGLTLEQAATVLGIAPATADRYWAYARAFLHQEIAESTHDD